MDRWGYWLNEPIFTDKGVYRIEKRKHAIHAFCFDGLIPFVESFGYRFRFNDIDLYRNFLSFLFKIYNGYKLRPLSVDIPYADEQYETFCYNLSSERWESFWNEWGELEDFEKDHYGHHIQFELHAFVWSWIDFDRSYAIQDVYAQLQGEETMEESKGKDDPYLQETSKRDYQDRHW